MKDNLLRAVNVLTSRGKGRTINIYNIDMVKILISKTRSKVAMLRAECPKMLAADPTGRIRYVKCIDPNSCVISQVAQSLDLHAPLSNS